MLMTCTPAVLNPDGLQAVETENETAVLGTLIHALCQKLVETGTYDLPELKTRLSESDFTRASILFNNFLKMWNSALPYMTAPKTEVGFNVELAHCLLSGHIDCLSFGRGEAFVLDYKTGRTHEDHYHQMAAYAYGTWGMAGKPSPYVVHVTVVYLEDNSIHNYSFSHSSLVEWEAEVSAKIVDTRYVVGRKCATCSLLGSCPAYPLYAGKAIELFSGLHDDSYRTVPSWESLSEEDRGALADKMYVVEKAIDRVKMALRNHVKSKGPIAVGGGKEYTLVEQTEKGLDARIALPVLTRRLEQSTLAENTALSLNGILSAYAAKAAKGQKTKAKEELLNELDKAGAIVRVTTQKMYRRPIGEKQLEA